MTHTLRISVAFLFLLGRASAAVDDRQGQLPVRRPDDTKAIVRVLLTEARSAAEVLPDGWSQSLVFCESAELFAAAAMLDEAAATLQRISDPQFRERAAVNVGRAWAEQGNFGEALPALRESLPPDELDAIRCEFAIQRILRGELADAKQLLQQVQCEFLTLHPLCILSRRQFETGRVKAARRTAWHVRAILRGTSDDEISFVDIERQRAELAILLARLGLFEDAHAEIEMMPSGHFRDLALGVIALRELAAKGLSAAASTARRMTYGYKDTVTEIAQRLAKDQKWKELAEFARSTDAPEVDVVTAEARLRSGDVVKALEIAASMRDVRARAYVLLQAASHLQDADQKARAAALISESIGLADSVDHSENTIDLFCSAAELQACGGDRETAMATVQSAMKIAESFPPLHLGGPSRVDALQRIATALDELNADELCVASLNRAWSLTGTTTSMIPEFVAQLQIVKRAAGLGRTVLARELADAVQDDVQRANLYCVIAAEEVKNGSDLDRVIAWARSVESPILRSEALIGIVEALTSRTDESAESPHFLWR